jgi:hypothetical protein
MAIAECFRKQLTSLADEAGLFIFYLVGLLFAMSLRIAWAAAFGSAAAVMGRPITSLLAPAASANCGVAMRF